MLIVCLLLMSVSDSNDLGTASSVNDFELISTAASRGLVAGHWERILRGLLTLTKLRGHWERIVRGLLTLTKLRGFFGHLGNYLKAVKARGV